MSTTIISVSFKINDVLTDAGTSAKLSNEGATAGVIRNDTSAVVVSDATDLTNVGTGLYQYSLTDPASDLTYTAYFEFVHAGETYRLTSVVTGTVTAALTTTIGARVQKNPEILVQSPTFVADLVTRAQDFIVDYCNLPLYPALAKGYSKGSIQPTVNLSALSTNKIWISVNGGSFYEVNPTLANCTSGAATAAELQTQIRAVDAYGFDEVTVTYTSTSGADYFQITSGRYGEGSRIHVDFTEDYKHVPQAMGLGPGYGGTERQGSEVDDQLDTAAVLLVEILYRKVGVEGAKSGSVPDGVGFTAHDIDPGLRSMLNVHRRLWK